MNGWSFLGRFLIVVIALRVCFEFMIASLDIQLNYGTLELDRPAEFLKIAPKPMPSRLISWTFFPPKVGQPFDATEDVPDVVARSEIAVAFYSMIQSLTSAESRAVFCYEADFRSYTSPLGLAVGAPHEDLINVYIASRPTPPAAQPSKYKLYSHHISLRLGEVKIRFSYLSSVSSIEKNLYHLLKPDRLCHSVKR